MAGGLVPGEQAASVQVGSLRDGGALSGHCLHGKASQAPLLAGCLDGIKDGQAALHRAGVLCLVLLS